MSKAQPPRDGAAPQPPAAPAAAQDGRPKITPVPVKIGEGSGNLARREDWFRRRSGESR